MKITKELLEDMRFKQNLSWKTIRTLLCISKKQMNKLQKELDIRPKTKEEIVASRVSTCRKRYGVDNPMQNTSIRQKAKDTIVREDVVEKRKQTVREKYGCDIVSQNEDVKQKMYNTNLERYGYTNPCNSPQIKAKLSRRVKAAFATGIPKQKEYETRKKNNSFNLSRLEEQVYQMLLTKFPKEDIFRQHKTEAYPFNCDFYIKSLDLYVEFQGTWVHGKQSFDPNNSTHQKIVENWKTRDTKYFSYAIKVWTIQDPQKRRIAQENNLNWKEFFSLEEVEAWLESLD